MSVRSQQLKQLYQLLNKASKTEIGQEFGFGNIDRYKTFRERLPVNNYENIKPVVRRLKEGENNLHWPGPVKDFSISAGTTGSGKHLPLTKQRLQSDKRFLRKVAVSYFRQRPSISPLLGRHLSLPGSLEEVTYKNHTIRMGEISGFLGAMTPPLLNLCQLISPGKLLDSSFSIKFERVLLASLRADVRVITAVPSWILTLFQEVLKQTGKESIDEVWPNLQVLICGGVKLENYRSHLQALCGDLDPDFFETYGASEGYFSYTHSLGRDDMKLVIDNGIFYEWVPYSQSDNGRDVKNQKALPTWNVQTGVPYSMVVSTNAGLWRYKVNDVVEFTSLNPPTLVVKGRTQEVLDPFGEAVYGWEAEKALSKSCKQYNTDFDCFTLGSIMSEQSRRPRHFWFVQFQNPDKLDKRTLNALSKSIDRQLRSMNRHYAIRRESKALDAPEVRPLSSSSIQYWLKINNKLGAQGKLPRILKIRKGIKDFIKITEPV